MSNWLVHIKEPIRLLDTNLDSFPLNFHRLHCEIHTDCVPLPFDKSARLKPLNHAGLPHTDISDQNYFEHEIITVVSFQQRHVSLLFVSVTVGQNRRWRNSTVCSRARAVKAAQAKTKWRGWIGTCRHSPTRKPERTWTCLFFLNESRPLRSDWLEAHTADFTAVRRSLHHTSGGKIIENIPLLWSKTLPFISLQKCLCKLQILFVIPSKLKFVRKVSNWCFYPSVYSHFHLGIPRRSWTWWVFPDWKVAMTWCNKPDTSPPRPSSQPSTLMFNKLF